MIYREMKKRSLKLLIFKSGTIVISVVVLLLVSEIILRTYGPKYYRFNNDSEEYYINPRGYHIPLRQEGEYIVYGLNYNSSPEGYRLPDLPLAGNSEKENLILGLGDSFTYGRGVKYEDIYLVALENRLNRDGYNIGIKNCARIGADIDTIFKIYLEESSQKAYPFVIYGLVLNDFDLRVRIFGDDFIDFNNEGYVFNKMRQVSRLYNFLCYAIEKIRLHSRTTKAYLESFRGEYAEVKFAIIRQLHQDIKANKGKLIIVLFPLLYNFERYPFYEVHEKISVFCDKEGIPLVDLLSAFSRYKAENLWANPTDHHPNETAHRIAGEELYNFLRRGNKLLPR